MFHERAAPDPGVAAALPGGGGSVETDAAMLPGRLVGVHPTGVIVEPRRPYALHPPIALGGVSLFARPRRVGRAGSQAAVGESTPSLPDPADHRILSWSRELAAPAQFSGSPYTPADR